jgi:selenocysteine-specific elongation factor
MRVIATAGHVDHGKSTLIRALTGMEPDRWAEERRRGMTIDLGYAWTTIAGGEHVAFVDVPGHHRFLSNMLAGVGPAPAVLMVVAADEGWRQQSEEHLSAIDALGIEVGLLAVTRSDLADPGPAMAEARDRLAASRLGAVEVIAVSGATGQGLDELRAALARTVRMLPPPDVSGPVRLWVDRAFTITGSGTVVTATLGAGTIQVDDRLELQGRPVTVRGIQSLGLAVDSVSAVSRVALNLRGVARAEVGRGDPLLTPGAWHRSSTVDARVRLLDTAAAGEPVGGRLHGAGRGVGVRGLVGDLVLHVGSAAVSVRVRVLDEDVARLQLARPLPLRAGDRAVLRDPGRQQVVAAVTLLDVDPPALSRRGAARTRAAELADRDVSGDSVGAVLAQEVARRGVMRRAQVELLLGVEVTDGDIEQAATVLEVRGWLVDAVAWQAWLDALPDIVDRYLQQHPLEPGMPAEAVRHALGLSERELLPPLLAETSLRSTAGRVSPPGHRVSLGAAEPALARLEERLRDKPFRAPERGELQQLGLGIRELATAAKAERILRLAPDIILLPDAPQRAATLLGALDQPFTTSQARIALDTTRRVVVPLLEYLDSIGLTQRLDGSLRQVFGGVS